MVQVELFYFGARYQPGRGVMFLATVTINLEYTDEEKVRFGPYSFDDSAIRTRWERQLHKEFRRLNTELGLKPSFISATVSSQGEPDDVMAAPPPREIVNNLRRLWEFSFRDRPPGKEE
jgi:hypothetical protein